jgi:hypothetical protein
MIVEIGDRTVQLDEVERVGLQIFQAAVDPAVEVLLGVPLDGLRRQAFSGLGGDERPLAAALLERPGDQLLRAAVAVDVGGVDEGDAGVQSGVQRGNRLVVIDLAPGSADRPRAETDFADRAAGTAELPGVLFSSPSRAVERFAQRQACPAFL